MTTLFELKENMATLSEAIRGDADWISEKAAQPAIPMEDIEKKKAHRDDLVKRFDLLKEEHDRVEKAQRAEMARQKGGDGLDPAALKAKAKGDFYKAALTGGDVRGVVTRAYEQLGAIPGGDSDLGGGEHLLPVNLSSELITEPYETNSLRTLERVTNVAGLEVPMLGFTIDDAALEDVTDKDTAREIQMQGNKISFGRNKTMIKAEVSDTVVHGSPLALQGEIDNRLRSGLAVKEKMRAFDPSPDNEHAHMSFYACGIRAVKGAAMLDAIIAAYGDLPDLFAENAVCVMRRSDYVAMLKDLTNGAESLFGKKPEDVIGIPVAFNDRASIPVVGDFRYAQLNYDPAAIYDTDKDIDRGVYKFVLTAWGDHQILLKSAFRLAVIGQAPTLTGVTITGAAKVGEVLGIDAAYSSGTPSPNLSYQWKRSNTAGGTYADIDGAVYPNYTPAVDDIGKFLKASVTASGSATGSVTSSATTAVAAATT